MEQEEPQAYSEEEVQRRVEALIRASRRPPLRLEDIPRQRRKAKPKGGGEVI
jgi:hypothetical protein